MKMNMSAIALISMASPIMYAYAETAEPRKAPESATAMLSRIQGFVPTVKTPPTSGPNVTGISGQYSAFGPSTKLPMGRATAGAELYLLPDKTYICTVWALVLPPTICDKGTWDIDNGFIILDSDGSVPFEEWPKDHRYLPLTVTRDSGNSTLLMGTQLAYSGFLQKVEGNPELREYTDLSESTLLLHSLERARTISQDEMKSIRDMLMKESWRPGSSKERD